MKAAQIKEYGGPDIIKISEIAAPLLKEDQVLVEVYASAINPFDYKLRRGYMKDIIPLQFPITIGADFSGVVTKAGGQTTYKPGDKVYGSAIVLNGGSGAIADYAAANAANISLKPTNVRHAEAASLVLVGVSALQALRDHLQLKAGQKILVHGGAGGIGSVAIQFAKHLGAYVATTARGVDLNFVSGLGADETINYEQEAFTEKVHGFDAVFDTVGGEVYTKSFEVLKNGGVIISMVEAPSEELAAKHSVKAIKQQSRTDTESLQHLSALVEKGAIKPQIDRVFSLPETAAAFKYSEEEHPRGKVIIQIKA